MNLPLAALIAITALGSALPSSTFHAWVADGYIHRDPLRGWIATAHLMAREAGPSATVHTGGTASELKSFLAAHRSQSAVIYLAAHHHSDGTLDLPRERSVRWANVWPQQGTEHWTVILDLCHAEAALPHIPAGCHLTTSASAEVAWEISLASPRTAPLSERERTALLTRLRSQLPPTWDGRLSAWGLGWALTGPAPFPASASAWQQRLHTARTQLQNLRPRRTLVFRSTWNIFPETLSPEHTSALNSAP